MPVEDCMSEDSDGFPGIGITDSLSYNGVLGIKSSLRPLEDQVLLTFESSFQPQIQCGIKKQRI